MASGSVLEKALGLSSKCNGFLDFLAPTYRMAEEALVSARTLGSSLGCPRLPRTVEADRPSGTSGVPLGRLAGVVLLDV